MADLRVDVLIRDRRARVVIEQAVRNAGGAPAGGDNLWPVPAGLQVTRFRYLVDGRPVPSTRVEGLAADAVYRAAAEMSDDPRVLAYLGRPFYRGSVGPIPARGEVRMRMEFEALLPVRDGVVTFHHPLDTNGFSHDPIDRARLQITLEGTAPITFRSSPTYALEWKSESPKRVVGRRTVRNTRLERDLLVYFSTAADAAAGGAAAERLHAAYEAKAGIDGPDGRVREAGGRTLLLRDGFWTDRDWPRAPWTIRVRRFSPAYWELLWQRPELKAVLATGRRVRVVLRKQPIEIDALGTSEFTAAERARLKLPSTGLPDGAGPLPVVRRL